MRLRTVLIALAILVAGLLATVATGTASAHGTVISWQSPTKNIGCVMADLDSPWSVRCDINRRSWSPPPRPKRCGLDFGQGIGLGGHGRPGFVCAGDTALGQGPVLGYGHSISRGLIKCTSLETGMTCVETRHHHGFVMSRQSYRLF